MNKSFLSQLNSQLAHPKPDTKKERAAKRRARSERRSKFHEDVITAAGGKCENIYCLSILKRVKERLHAHHITYRSDGGEDSITNGIALCPDCHKKAHEGWNRWADRIGNIPGRKWMQLTLDLVREFHPDRFRWHEAYETLKKINESNR